MIVHVPSIRNVTPSGATAQVWLGVCSCGWSTGGKGPGAALDKTMAKQRALEHATGKPVRHARRETPAPSGA